MKWLLSYSPLPPNFKLSDRTFYISRNEWQSVAQKEAVAFAHLTKGSHFSTATVDKQVVLHPPLLQALVRHCIWASFQTT